MKSEQQDKHLNEIESVFDCHLHVDPSLTSVSVKRLKQRRRKERGKDSEQPRSGSRLPRDDALPASEEERQPPAAHRQKRPGHLGAVARPLPSSPGRAAWGQLDLVPLTVGFKGASNCQPSEHASEGTTRHS